MRFGFRKQKVKIMVVQFVVESRLQNCVKRCLGSSQMQSVRCMSCRIKVPTILWLREKADGHYYTHKMFTIVRIFGLRNFE